eukprot:732949_1
MEVPSRAEFKKLLSKKGNNHCIDCGSNNPKWASVNNGCTLCIECAGSHRGMGVHISFVRSLTMDKWSKLQLATLRNGGNNTLKQFWKQQKFPNNITTKQRFDNNAMDKYRNNLLRKAKNKSPEAIIFIGYQKRVIQPKNINNK